MGAALLVLVRRSLAHIVPDLRIRKDMSLSLILKDTSSRVGTVRILVPASGDRKRPARARAERMAGTLPGVDPLSWGQLATALG